MNMRSASGSLGSRHRAHSRVPRTHHATANSDERKPLAHLTTVHLSATAGRLRCGWVGARSSTLEMKGGEGRLGRGVPCIVRSKRGHEAISGRLHSLGRHMHGRHLHADARTCTCVHILTPLPYGCDPPCMLNEFRQSLNSPLVSAANH